MERQGGCACGAVRYVAQGGPLRVGLCHCLTCRKRHGAPCNAFAAYRRDKVRVRGATSVWREQHGLYHGCATCGAPLFWTALDESDDEIEIHLGGLDDTGQFTPQYEIWVKRREPWLPPLNVPQYVENRPAGMAS
ncbi:GFA family protein [Caulobacter soli]|uniref:GFA family protein n=1 Tax=Caulobacter soli TaxID=2708539 RepID=UPI0013EBD7F5|nr:GFA family protein [Caulobacter soli]